MKKVISLWAALSAAMVSVALAQVDFPAIQQQAEGMVSSVPRDQANAAQQLQGSQGQVPGFVPQDLSSQQAAGDIYLRNPGQLTSQGDMNLSPESRFLQNSYNTRPQVNLTTDDLLFQNSQRSVTQRCTTQTLCARWETDTISKTQEVSCHVGYWESPQSCSYPVPPARIEQGNGSGSLCTDDQLYARVYQENSTTYHLQLLDTGPSGEYHRNCGGSGSGGGIDDWHTLRVITLPVPPASFSFSISASGGGCLDGSILISSSNQTVSLTICGSRGAQRPFYTYDYRFEMPPLPVSSETIAAACGAYMNPGCSYLSETCTAADCRRDYLCIDPSKMVDGCSSYGASGCVLQSSQCVLSNSFGQCLDQKNSYACTSSTVESRCAQEVTQVTCPQSPTVLCLNPADCFDTSSPKNTDMALAVSNMQGLQAIQETKTPNPLLIFGGNSERCRNPLSGANCCGLDDNILISCNSEELLLGQHRSAGECVEVGTFCSNRVSIGFTSACVAKATSFCCFSSKLVRLIQEQGRPQLGIGWGSAEGPDCRGLTPEELQRIDFSRIDFTEYYADINAKPIDVNAFTSQTQNSPLLNQTAPQVVAPSGTDPIRFQNDLEGTFQSHAP